jgi:hypothetical protein
MHIGADEFVSKWNDLAMHLQAQVTVLADRNGVNLEQFSGWMRENRSSEAVKALTTHALNRDVVGAYGKHMADLLIPEEAAPLFRDNAAPLLRDNAAPRNGMMPPPDSEMIAPPITE